MKEGEALACFEEEYHYDNNFSLLSYIRFLSCPVLCGAIEPLVAASLRVLPFRPLTVSYRYLHTPSPPAVLITLASPVTFPKENLEYMLG